MPARTTEEQSKSKTEEETSSPKSKASTSSSSSRAKSSSSSSSSTKNSSSASAKSSPSNSSKNTETGSKKSDSSEKKEAVYDENDKMVRTFENFVQTEELQSLLERSERYIHAGFPVHFTGAAGVGKTSLALQLASRLGQPVVLLNGNKDLSNVDLLGGYVGYKSKRLIDNYVRTVYKREDEVKEQWSGGRLYEAATKGYTVIYDEFTRSMPETNNLFLSILQEGILPLYGVKQRDTFVNVHPDFKMIFTSNPEEYVGVYETQDALADRLITIHMQEQNIDKQAEVLADRTDISEGDAKTIVKAVSRVKEICQEEDKPSPSFRASVMIAEISSKSDISINTKDDDFFYVCQDVLGAYIYGAKGHKSNEETEKLLKQELKKL